LWTTMRRTLIAALALAACAKPAPAPKLATSTLLTAIGDSTTIIESVAIFGGKLYTTSWQGTIYEIDPAAPTPKVVGRLPISCGYLGEVADSAGNLLIACQDSGTVYRVAHDRLGATDFDPKKDAKVFITGAGHANGITIAPDGHVWISGGDVDAMYHTGPNGGKAILFAEHFSPVSVDTTIPVRIYVTNGAAVDSKGNVYTMNTGTGTIWRLEVKPDHQLGAITKVVESTMLVGADGVVVGPGDTLYATQNFRNGFSKISPTGAITVLVAMDTTLRFPAELVRDGSTFYIANLNFPVGTNANGHKPGATIAKVTLP
ncbi:MAG: SMP-30/gluconolactonase/LRE family protein, partial [Gemmatimonadota bacterium]